jgi:hypothetical protein
VRGLDEALGGDKPRTVWVGEQLHATQEKNQNIKTTRDRQRRKNGAEDRQEQVRKKRPDPSLAPLDVRES